MSKRNDAAIIREFLGHGRGNRRVRVSRDGEVTYYGSTVDTDRGHDYWHFGGWVEELITQAQICPPDMPLSTVETMIAESRVDATDREAIVEELKEAMSARKAALEAWYAASDPSQRGWSAANAGEKAILWQIRSSEYLSVAERLLGGEDALLRRILA